MTYRTCRNASAKCAKTRLPNLEFEASKVPFICAAIALRSRQASPLPELQYYRVIQTPLSSPGIGSLWIQTHSDVSGLSFELSAKLGMIKSTTLSFLSPYTMNLPPSFKRPCFRSKRVCSSLIPLIISSFKPPDSRSLSTMGCTYKPLLVFEQLEGHRRTGRLSEKSHF